MYIINYPHLQVKQQYWQGGISNALTKGLAGFSSSFIDPFYGFNSFYQREVCFEIALAVNCRSEQYAEKERVFATTDDDDDDDDNDDSEFLSGVIITDDSGQ